MVGVGSERGTRGLPLAAWAEPNSAQQTTSLRLSRRAWCSDPAKALARTVLLRISSVSMRGARSAGVSLVDQLPTLPRSR